MDDSPKTRMKDSKDKRPGTGSELVQMTRRRIFISVPVFPVFSDAERVFEIVKTQILVSDLPRKNMTLLGRLKK